MFMGRGVSDMIQFGVGIEAHCEREHDTQSPDLAWVGMSGRHAGHCMSERKGCVAVEGAPLGKEAQGCRSPRGE